MRQSNCASAVSSQFGDELWKRRKHPLIDWSRLQRMRPSQHRHGRASQVGDSLRRDVSRALSARSYFHPEVSNPVRLEDGSDDA